MKKAFTLLELLVTMAIVGITIAFLMPVLGRAREQARRAQCANNLRQHGIAWHIYLDDYGERFPVWGLPIDGGVTSSTFGGKQGNELATYGAQYRVLNRYLDIYDESSPNLEVFHCPDDIKRLNHQDNKTVFDYYGNSYWANIRVFRFGWATFRPRPLSTITRPYNRIWIEICRDRNTPGHGGKGLIYPNTPVMVLFVDGHASGTFLYPEDFEKPLSGIPDTTKKVLSDPNGTSSELD